MKKKEIGKRVISKITLFVSAVFLLAVTFHSCQQDDFFDLEELNAIALQGAEMETVVFSQTVVYPEIFAGPATFSPVKGKMITQTVTLDNPNYEDFETAFALVVQNGDQNGLNKVMGANIYVNGMQLTTIADFRKAPAVIHRKINNLGASTTIDVEVKGKTTGVLTVWIEGTLKDGPLATFTDSRDGNVYEMVSIGTQLWMAENLSYLPSVNRLTESSATEQCFYVYGYDGTDLTAAKATENYATYGVLYNWTAAQTVCPTGWHLPSADEWIGLENYLIANGYNYDGSTEGNKIAKALAAKTNWLTSSSQGTPGYMPELNNGSRFAALPGGHRSMYYGLWSYIGNVGNWWTSTYSGTQDSYGNEQVYTQQINNNEKNTWRRANGSIIYDGFSIRCIKDED
jgi:uncharacterized protein (TIGR02145 family)